MKISVYAVKDSYLGFGHPMLRDNDSVAIRAFEYDCKLENSVYISHPESYQLFYIGEYDTDTAFMESETVRYVASASDYIKE